MPDDQVMIPKNVTFPPSLLSELKNESRRTGENVNVLIRRACREYLDRLELSRGTRCDK